MTVTVRERLNLIRNIQNAEPENGMFSVSVEALNEMLDVLKESIPPVLSVYHSQNPEKVIKELHDVRRYLESKEWSDRCASPHIDAINDALELLKELYY